LEKARSVNMPRTNIDRAIMKGLGQSASGVRFEEVLYEGYGPVGVGLIVAAITDNRNRTGAEIRGIFEKFGGSLGGPGSASYLFKIEQGGVRVTVTVPMPVTDENARNKVLQMVEALEENDDVETITHNMQ
jgi:transcriptional/translational regulatory protein YebC/TACO1